MKLSFELKELEADETVPETLTLQEKVEYIAEKKGLDYQPVHNEILITADTLVGLGTKTIGKPKNIEEARQVLQYLSGKKHVVYSGVCVKSAQKKVVFSEKSEVVFASLDSNVIDFYIQHCAVLDKAGAYGIQDWIGLVGVERIAGSYTNILGLPTQRLFSVLMQF